jgi:hypothetical protein
MSTANPSLSDYEQIRARNIERNNAKLRELGLLSRDEEEVSNAAAWGRRRLLVVANKEQSSDEGEWSDHEDDDELSPGQNKKRKRTKKPDTESSPSRKSRRLQGLNPDGGKILPLEPKTTEEIHEERQKRVQECRLVRLRAAKAMAETGGADQAAKENPTATYDHCLMRVRTMTDKALANRVKAIERAAGRHCVIKMAIFKSCLQDEGKWELSELASEALERLKGLQPPPES